MFRSSALILLIATPLIAEGLPPEEWGQIGDWKILAEVAKGDGCYMEKAFESGTIVQIGFAASRDGAFFAAYNPSWTNIESGNTGTVLLDFKDSRFQGEVVATTLNGVPGGYAFFNNPEFASEFAKRVSVTIVGESGKSEDIDLSGTKRALESLKECQRDH